MIRLNRYTTYLLPMLAFILTQQAIASPADRRQTVRQDTSVRFFDGIYLGVAAGSQNIFGGSFVDGVDILAQDSRFVLDWAAGFRKQFFRDRILAGVEFQVGFTDGDLAYAEPAAQRSIKYENSTQSGLGLTLGIALGKRKNILLFGYGNETKRNFDVTVMDGAQSYRQKDKQGMLKYGLGVETHLWKGLNARATAGRLRVDFGDQVTNIDVEDRMDFMIGLVYQFRIKIKPAD